MAAAAAHSKKTITRRASKIITRTPLQAWAQVRTAIRTGSLRAAMMRARAQRLSAAFKTPKQTRLLVPSQKALAATPAWQQGDASMYTEDKVQSRFRLRTAPAVQEALHEWWAATLRSLQSGGDVEACTVHHDRYVSLGMSIYRQLVPGRVTSHVYQSEARRAAEGDWARDCKGQGALGRADMLDGLFELADLYVPTVDAADYAEFLRELLEKVSIAGAEEPPLLWREKVKYSLRVSPSTPVLGSSSRPSTPMTTPPPTPPKTPLRSPLRPIGERATTPPASPGRPMTPSKRPLTPISPPGYASKLPQPATAGGQRRLHPSFSTSSVERRWLAAAVPLEPQAPTMSSSKRVLPAIASSASLLSTPRGGPVGSRLDFA